MFVNDPLGDGEDLIDGYFLLPDARGELLSGLFQIAGPDTDQHP